MKDNIFYGNTKANQSNFPFVLPDLPFRISELAPHMTEETLKFHHGKHHNTYVQNLNKLIDNDPNKDLETIIVESRGDSTNRAIFNNAAQVWNHSFFWHSLSPNGGGKPEKGLLQQITSDYDSFEDFCQKFKEQGMGQFGSGWVWLVFDSDKSCLEIVKTSNAETPLTEKKHCILCCDVWEHAYYLDYQNRRADFIDVFINSLANWHFAEQNFKNAK